MMPDHISFYSIIGEFGGFTTRYTDGTNINYMLEKRQEELCLWLFAEPHCFRGLNHLAVCLFPSAHVAPEGAGEEVMLHSRVLDHSLHQMRSYCACFPI